MKKKVVLLSGGLDSSTLLGKVVNDFGSENVIAVTLTYGQKHDKEITSANDIANYYNVSRHIIRDLSIAFDFSNSPLLKHSDKEIPDKSYAEQLEEKPGTVVTYIPFRNGLFLSFVTAIAYSVGADTVYYGAHADDAAGAAYPDCTPEFIEHMGKAIYEGTGKQVRLIAPFQIFTKADIVTLGHKLGVPYELTWSCYKGGNEACGECATCIDRLNAFKANGLIDPIKYKNDVNLTWNER